MGRRGRRTLVVVSNRGPLRRRGRELVRSSGGLVTALDPVLRENGGVWVSAAEGDESIAPPADLGYSIGAVTLSRRVQHQFYSGFSNGVLWPLLHSFPTTIRVAEAPWADYVVANRAFADAALHALSPGDLAWVHDYHLMLAPGMMREAQPRLSIGWFCHVPWPNPDLFCILPWRRKLLEGLLGASLLGFHTERYATNFVECVRQLTDARVDTKRRVISSVYGETRVVVAPIGIPTGEIDALAADPWVQNKAQELRRSMGNRRMVLGVDRLDYTKGIPERLLAYENLLSRARGNRDQWVMVQVMVPSRTDVQAYAALKAEVDRLVGSIDGRYGRTGTVPIHYLYRSLDPKELYAHYLAADIALVTPLRDGMNLVAQEYVAARRDEKGVLILSELAGASDHLRGALTVNPYDVDEIADALERARDMDEAEVRRRMRSMRAAVASLDVHGWAHRFLEGLETRPGNGKRAAVGRDRGV